MVKDETSSDITVSLEWAKKLKEAGWLQDGALFCWWLRIGHTEYELSPAIFLKNGEFAAPTAEEILRRLPEAIKYPVRNAIEYELFIRPFDDSDERHWEVIYAKDIDNVDNTPLHETTGTLANAAAAMYCYLADNKLLP